MYELFIAGRYLKSKKRGGIISFPTLFPFVVIVLGVACITIFLSIMNGFESVVIDRFLVLDSHVQIIGKGMDEFPEPEKFREILESIPEVAAFAPFVSGKVILFAERTVPVTLKGIDLSRKEIVSGFQSTVGFGTNDFTSADSQSTHPGIVIGDGIAYQLGVIGSDEIRIMSYRGGSGYYSVPDVSRFTVTGIFKTDIGEYDYIYGYVSIDEAQRFFRMGNAITGFDVNAESRDKTRELAEAIRRVAPDSVVVNTWYDMHKNLYSSMKLEKIAAIVILSLIVLVATFSIGSSLIMLVLEKRREIGILRSMGSTGNSINLIFITTGMLIGSAGTFLGLALGFTVCWLQIQYEFFLLPQGLYIIEALPVYIKLSDFLIVGGITLILTYIATIYPARKASLLRPAQALRYE
ncbi:ABC transporter permease [candidate division KSB1 bacterium]